MAAQKSLLTGIGSMAVLTITSKIVRLLILMVTARFLTPEDFGIVASFGMVLALAYLFSEFGLTKTLIQRPIMNESHIGSALIISFIFSLLTGFFLFFSSGWLETLTGISGIKLPLQISAFLFLLLPISNVCAALFQRNGDVVFIGKIQAFATIFGNVCITIPLLWLDIGYWAILIGIFTTELISIITICWIGRSFIRFSFAKQESIEIIQYASAFVSHNVLALISKQIDIALVGRYLGKTDLGNYSRTMQLVEFPSQIYFLVVDRVVFPAMASMKNDDEKFRLFFIEIYSLLLLALSVGTIVLYFGANEIINIMMGDGWDIVIVLLEIMCIRIIIKCITTFIDSFLTAYGKIKELTYKSIISLGVYSTLIYIGVGIGIEAVAYAVVLASVINIIMSIFIATYCVRIPLKSIITASFPALVSSLFIFGFYLVISSIISAPNLVSIVLASLIWGGMCYFFPSKILLSNNGDYYIRKFKSKKS